VLVTTTFLAALVVFMVWLPKLMVPGFATAAGVPTGKATVDQLSLEMLEALHRMRLDGMLVPLGWGVVDQEKMGNTAQWLSGVARATMPMPGLPPPPPRFSMITDWPSNLGKAFETMRAMMSVGPPAANGTISVITRSG